MKPPKSNWRNGPTAPTSCWRTKPACAGDGTIDHLLAREKHAGVDKCVVLCAATAPAQVIPANNYAMSLQKAHAEVIGFGTLHPGYANWEAELQRINAAGLRGSTTRACCPFLKRLKRILFLKSISATTSARRKILPALTSWRPFWMLFRA